MGRHLRFNLCSGLVLAALLYALHVGAAFQGVAALVSGFGNENAAPWFERAMVGFEARLALFLVCVGLLLGVWGSLLSPRTTFLPIGFLVAVLLIREVGTHPALFEVKQGSWMGSDPFLKVATMRGVAEAASIALACAAALALLRLYLLMFRRRWKIGALAAAVVLMAISIREWIPARRNQGPNLLILAADSLHPEHFTSAGYPRDTTPNIDRLQSEGVSFSNMYVPLARTIPSWTTMLTGLYPPRHGITDMFPAEPARAIRVPTLPRRLNDAGYTTSVVSDYAGDFFSFVDYGFRRKHLPPAMSAEVIAQRELLIAAPELLPFLNHPLGRFIFPVLRFLPNNADPGWLTDDVLAEIHEGARHEKFFITSFYSVTHVPYAAPSPYYRRYVDPGYSGENRYSSYLRNLSDLAKADRPLPPREFDQVVALYDGALRAFDGEVGRIVRELKRSGLWENTTLVVLGDHAEVFNPHIRSIQHGNDLDTLEDVRIPFVVVGPGFRSRGVTLPTLSSSVDLMPTLLGALGVPIPAGLDGFQRLIPEGPKEAPTPPIYFETGLWLSSSRKKEDRSIPYPPMNRLLVPDAGGHLIVRPEYFDLVRRAKHRGVYDGNQFLLYRPAAGKARITVRPESNQKTDQALRRKLFHELQERVRETPGARFNPWTDLLEFHYEVP